MLEFCVELLQAGANQLVHAACVWDKLDYSGATFRRVWMRVHRLRIQGTNCQFAGSIYLHACTINRGPLITACCCPDRRGGPAGSGTYALTKLLILERSIRTNDVTCITSSTCTEKRRGSYKRSKESARRPAGDEVRRWCSVRGKITRPMRIP